MPNPANIYLFLLNNRNTRKRFEIMFKVNNKNIKTMPDVGLVFLLLALNIFQIFFWCFYC